MLTRPDLGLVRRDPALPGLSILLDADELVDALSRAVPFEVRAAVTTYLRYKPGTNCVGAYRLVTSAGDLLAYAKAYGPDAPQKIEKALQRPTSRTPLGVSRIAWSDVGVVVSIFPHDDKLKTLVGWHEREFIADLGIGRRVDALEPLRYKPERRLVARGIAGGIPVAAVKIYTRDGFRPAARNPRQVVERGELRLPRLLARSKPRRAVAFEWIDGSPLADAIRAGETAAVSAAGAGLAEIHGQQPASRLPHAPRGATLRAAGRQIARLCPDLEWHAHATVQELVERLGALPRDEVVVHGDFHAGQVVVGADGPVLLDLDRLQRGDRAADLGSFRAHLEREAVEGRLAAHRLRQAQDALLDGYAAVRPVPDHIGLHAAAGLFRLCPESFRYRDPDWPRRMAALLARTRKILDEAGERCTAA